MKSIKKINYFVVDNNINNFVAFLEYDDGTVKKISDKKEFYKILTNKYKSISGRKESNIIKELKKSNFLSIEKKDIIIDVEYKYIGEKLDKLIIKRLSGSTEEIPRKSFKYNSIKNEIEGLKGISKTVTYEPTKNKSISKLKINKKKIISLLTAGAIALMATAHDDKINNQNKYSINNKIVYDVENEENKNDEVSTITENINSIEETTISNTVEPKFTMVPNSTKTINPTVKITPNTTPTPTNTVTPTPNITPTQTVKPTDTIVPSSKSKFNLKKLEFLKNLKETILQSAKSVYEEVKYYVLENKVSDEYEIIDENLKDYTFKGIKFRVVKSKNGFTSLKRQKRDKCYQAANGYANTIISGSNAEIHSRVQVGISCDSIDELLKIAAHELLAGRPSVVQVNGKRNTNRRHFVVIDGIRADADLQNLKQSDFLILDPAAGEIKILDFGTTNKSYISRHLVNSQDVSYRTKKENQYLIEIHGDPSQYLTMHNVRTLV